MSTTFASGRWFEAGLISESIVMRGHIGATHQETSARRKNGVVQHDPKREKRNPRGVEEKLSRSRGVNGAPAAVRNMQAWKESLREGSGDTPARAQVAS